MSPSSVMVIAAEFLMVYPVGMTGTGYISLFAIILTSGIIIFKQDHDRESGRYSVENAALKNGFIGYLSRCGSFLLPTFSSFQIRQQICCADRNSGRANIDHNAYTRSVRFSEDLNFIKVTE